MYFSQKDIQKLTVEDAIRLAAREYLCRGKPTCIRVWFPEFDEELGRYYFDIDVTECDCDYTDYYTFYVNVNEQIVNKRIYERHYPHIAKELTEVHKTIIEFLTFLSYIDLSLIDEYWDMFECFNVDMNVVTGDCYRITDKYTAYNVIDNIKRFTHILTNINRYIKLYNSMRW